MTTALSGQHKVDHQDLEQGGQRASQAAEISRQSFEHAFSMR
jgi:hypothetical protein